MINNPSQTPFPVHQWLKYTAMDLGTFGKIGEPQQPTKELLVAEHDKCLSLLKTATETLQLLSGRQIATWYKRRDCEHVGEIGYYCEIHYLCWRQK